MDESMKFQLKHRDGPRFENKAKRSPRDLDPYSVVSGPEQTKRFSSSNCGMI